jgi:hypothetical protein
MKKIFTLLSAVLFTYSASWAQPVLAQWTFETMDVSSTPGTTPTITTGSAAADAGVKATGSAVSGLHASALTVWSTPAGNGSANSLSSNNWGVGDYYQFQLSTTGYSGLSLSWDQMGSGTGPAQWKLSYSTDGTNFTDITTYTLPNITSWSATVPNPLSAQIQNLSSITALNNAANVYLRLSVTGTTSVNGTTVATAGSGRIDNFTVSGFTIFPLDLIGFAASLSNNKVIVSWSTANEVNFSNFEVQRSVNGKDFIAVSRRLEAKGGATNNYSFVDEAPVAGVSYYRLKLNDKDGSFKYSAIEIVKTKTIGVSVYPNPVRSSITVQHEVAAKGAVISVMDMSGKQATSITVQVGAVQTTINAAQLAPGSYMVVYTNNGVRQTKQFIKE